jgi:hypothetical protein
VLRALPGWWKEQRNEHGHVTGVGPPSATPLPLPCADSRMGIGPPGGAWSRHCTAPSCIVARRDQSAHLARLALGSIRAARDTRSLGLFRLPPPQLT